MRIYMAGEVSGNLKPFWKNVSARLAHGKQEAFDEAMKIFLAGGESRHWLQYERDERMKVYLAGVAPWRNVGLYDPVVRDYNPYILESFFYVDEDTERLLPHFGDFLLDSGAFTFMQGRGGAPDWDEYVERYANFITKNNIKSYFELDIDSVVGYDRVKELRRKLERLTNRPSIPVWHTSRGIDDYRRMCDEYDRVAIGGIVSGEITADKYGCFPALIKEAHKRNAKIHGLGFTALQWLEKCHFDSVDSTAWTAGNRFGYLYFFDGKTMRKKDIPKGHRFKDSRKVALINYTEWIKFQRWADTHL